MKIRLAKSAGFCFGVKRAIEIALQTADSRAEVYMLGDIVHNEDVVRQIREAGIKKIYKLRHGKNNILLIRAHGAARNTIRRALGLGYRIVDATCPMVKEIHKIAQGMEKKGYRIIIIGDKLHDEVRGIEGQLREKAIVISPAQGRPLNKLRGIRQAAVVVQSTQNPEKIIPIIKSLKKHIPDLKFFNTICRPTRMKQEEIRLLPLENDMVIIIGSKASANTKRLYEIAKSLNKRSYWVSSPEQIRARWLKGAGKIGVTAGASTPDYTIRETLAYLSRILS